MTSHTTKDRYGRRPGVTMRCMHMMAGALLALTCSLWAPPAYARADGPAPTVQASGATGAPPEAAASQNGAHEADGAELGQEAPVGEAPSDDSGEVARPSDEPIPDDAGDTEDPPDDTPGSLPSAATEAAPTQVDSPQGDTTPTHPDTDAREPGTPEVIGAPPTGPAALLAWAQENPAASYLAAGAAVVVIALLAMRAVAGREEGQGAESPSYHRRYHYVL